MHKNPCIGRNRQHIGRIGIPLPEPSSVLSHLTVRRSQTMQLLEETMYKAKAYSVASATSPFASTTIARRDPSEHDVQIEILFCGICHSDLHQARNEWSEVMPTVYPCVPGHEIVGRVTEVGSAGPYLKPGDLEAVG